MRYSLILVLMLSLVAAGCGGDDSVEGETSTTVAAVDESTASGDESGAAPNPTVVPIGDNRIVGIWITKSGYYKQYAADGTWGIGNTPEEAQTDPWVWGTYTFDGAQFTYYTDARSENCVMRDIDTGDRSGMVGVYDITFSEDGTEQFRTVVNDPCSGRVGQDTPKLIRHSAEAASDVPGDPLVGMWKTHHGYYVLRTADGVLNLGYTPNGAESNPWGWGTYTFDEGEGVLTFTSGVGTHCGDGSTGVYAAEIAQGGDLVTFTLVEDDCAARPQNMTGEQTKYSP